MLRIVVRRVAPGGTFLVGATEVPLPENSGGSEAYYP